jgi:hypothetical protein
MKTKTQAPKLTSGSMKAPEFVFVNKLQADAAKAYCRLSDAIDAAMQACEEASPHKGIAVITPRFFNSAKKEEATILIKMELKLNRYAKASSLENAGNIAGAILDLCFDMSKVQDFDTAFEKAADKLSDAADKLASLHN